MDYLFADDVLGSTNAALIGITAANETFLTGEIDRHFDETNRPNWQSITTWHLPANMDPAVKARIERAIVLRDQINAVLREGA